MTEDAGIEEMWRALTGRDKLMMDVFLVTASPEVNPEHSGMFCVHVGRNCGFGWTAPLPEATIYRPTLKDALQAATTEVDAWA